MFETIIIDSKDDEYPVIIKRNTLHNLNKYLSRKSDVFIITDTNVAPLYLDIVISQFENVDSFTFEAGESSKNMTTVMAIIEKMIQINKGRDTTILALGGGVVGDISGLVASLYMRGIKYISIPTTTLSQVDSSVGGKVAINLNQAKNVIGSFYHPTSVIIDPNTLKTLPINHFYSGLVESVKMGLTSNKALFELIYNKDVHDNIEDIIYLSIKTKAEIVELDEFDVGIRNILNFGHTLGHALEMKYNLLHGEAILIGMIHSLVSGDVKEKLLDIAQKFSIHVDYKLSSDLYDIILNDKKINNDQITLAVVDHVGEGSLVSYPISKIKEFLHE